MVNDFVGLFIIFLPRVVLFRVATLYIALRDRRPKGRERGKMSAQSAGGSWYLLTPVFIFTFLPPFYGLPHRLLCIMLLLPQNNYVLGCLKCCYHDHQMQKRLMVVGVMNK